MIISYIVDDHSRVKLKLAADESGSDYINANFVDVSSSDKQL